MILDGGKYHCVECSPWCRHIQDQAGDQADEHIGTHQNSRSDGCHDGGQLICTASHDDCASDVVGLATVTNHLNN